MIENYLIDTDDKAFSFWKVRVGNTNPSFYAGISAVTKMFFKATNMSDLSKIVFKWKHCLACKEMNELRYFKNG